MRFFWLAIAGCGGGSPCPEIDGGHRSDRPPNLALVILDDVGVDKLGLYDVNPTVARTPNLDRLASEGVRFENAYAEPTCTAARGVMQTGRAARRTGTTSIIWPFDTTWELPLEEQTLAEMVARAPEPYCPAMVGKWHLSSVVSPSGTASPHLQGYRWYEGSLNNLWVDTEAKSGGYDYFDFEKVEQDEQIHIRHEYATTDTTDDALWLLKRLPEPFLLVVAYNAAHNPWHVPPATLQGYGQSGLDLETEHLAMIEALDTELGRLFDALPDPTMLFVMGDNGTADQVVTPPALPERAKGSVYEGGTRVPLLVRGPGIPKGAVSASLFQAADLMPTFAGIAGVDLDEDPGAGPLDGVDQIDALRDPDVAVRTEVYTEDLDPTGPGPWTTDSRALRDERWKLIQNTDGSYQLFDLEGRPFDEGPNLLEGPLDAEEGAAFLRLRGELEAEVESLVPP